MQKDNFTFASYKKSNHLEEINSKPLAAGFIFGKRTKKHEALWLDTVVLFSTGKHGVVTF